MQQEETTGLPVNVAFVFEGEEENGSNGFHEAVNSNLHWFEGTQLIVISNTLWVGEKTPCLTYGMRGMIALSIEVILSSHFLSRCIGTKRENGHCDLLSCWEASSST